MPLSTAPSHPGLLLMLVGLYAYLLPLLIYVLWTTLALWDLGRRADLMAGRRWTWTGIVYVLPFAGAAAYLLAAAPGLPGRLKGLAIGGALGVYLATLGVGVLVGGVS